MSIKYGLISETDARTLEKTIDFIVADDSNNYPINVCEIGVYGGDTGRGICEYIKSKGRNYWITGVDSFKDKDGNMDTNMIRVGNVLPMMDDQGHQLPNIRYENLDRAELVDWVERFYGEYYFRPKAAWRVMRKAIFDNDERKRLYKEAREYLALRYKRKKFVEEQRKQAARVPAASAGD